MKLLALIVSVGITVMACNNSGDVNHGTQSDSISGPPPYNPDDPDRARIDSMANTRDTVSIDSLNDSNPGRRPGNR